ncbi:MAG: hypothetical protein ACFFEJ_17190 [Candidatus Thorarchaeota archaeon]
MGHQRSILIVCCLSLVIGLLFAFPSYSGDIHQTALNPEGLTLEGERQYITSAEPDDYVDSVQSQSYGTTLTSPPSGMGESSSTYSTLRESQTTTYSWDNLMTRSTFSSTPSGWSATNILYSGGYFRQDSSMYSGEIYCSTVDTTGSLQVRFTLNIECSWSDEEYGLSVYFWDGSNWDPIGDFVESSEGDQTFSSSSSQYRRSDFRVRVAYGTLDRLLVFKANNWRIDVQTSDTYYLFDAVYKFTGVAFDSYYVDTLYVDFADTSSVEDLTFYFEAGDTTPDNPIWTGNGNENFSVSIGTYLTGSECYVRIFDVLRSGDGDQDSWLIKRLYITFTDTAPVCDVTPVTAGLVNTDDVLAEYNYITTTVNVSDIDGISNIDYVALSIYDDSQTTNYFTLQYDIGGTFSEAANGNRVVLDVATSSSSSSPTSLELVFNYTISFECPQIENVDYYVEVYDIDAESDFLWHEANWDAVSTLTLDGGLFLDDRAGTPNRGNLGGTITATGLVAYTGATLFHPESSLIDIQVSCVNVSGSPWTFSTYNETDGNFTVDIFADDEIGLDSFSVVVNVGGSNQLDTTYSADYITDQILCVDLSSPSFIVDSTTTGYMLARLQYAYDGTNVTDGEYSLNGISMSWLGNDVWEASRTPNELNFSTYSKITIISTNSHNISSIDMNAQSVTIYWDELFCFISNPTESMVNPGTNASGILMWAEYYYADEHLAYTAYTGTLHVNDTVFVLYAPGQKGYKVSSADGDDLWGVFTIYSSNATYCIWEYLDPAPSWDPEPTNQISEYLSSFLYDVNATTPSGLGGWLVNDTSRFTIDEDGIISNISTLPVGVYPLWVYVNDIFGRAINQSFLIIVQDTTMPSWLQDPVLQTSELGDDFYYDLNATDPSGLHSWWLNTTIDFDIGPTGIIENVKILDAGTYGIRIYVNDTYDNTLYADLTIIIEDTTEPIWTTAPADTIVEFGDELEFQLAAYDLSILSDWWVNDTTWFSLSGDGLLGNATPLLVGEYFIRINVTDAHGNSISSTMKVTVQDTTSPSWIEPPIDKHVELDFPFVYDINATDLSGSVTWYLNDTIHFSIDAAGIIRNVTNLEVGTYPLSIGVEDTYSNYQNATFLVIVEDQTPPTWDQSPDDIEWEFGAAFHWDLNATDLSGLDTWWLNDTENFDIDDFGVIRNITLLPVSPYGLHIFVNDTFGGILDVEFTVFIIDTTAPTGLSPSSPLIMEFGDSIMVQFSAFDLSDISQWTMPISIYFSISTTGLLTNKSSVPVGEYTFNITVFDEYDNWDRTEYTIIVEDTTDPHWVDFPEILQVEFDHDLYYRLKASDLSENLDLEWRINDEVNFSIDVLGVLRSEVNLAVGNYSITVEVEDFYGNILEGSLIVQVRDTTPPDWIIAPQNRAISYGLSFGYQMSATDSSGAIYWSVNDTTHFMFSSPGYIENKTVLEIGIYTIDIIISDMYGNSRSDSMRITVQTASTTPTTTPSTPTPTEPGLPVEQILIALGVFGIGVILVIALSMKRIRKFVEQRTASMMEGKEDLGTALDYLDKIQEEHKPNEDGE